MDLLSFDKVIIKNREYYLLVQYDEQIGLNKVTRDCEGFRRGRKSEIVQGVLCSDKISKEIYLEVYPEIEEAIRESVSIYGCKVLSIRLDGETGVTSIYQVKALTVDEHKRLKRATTLFTTLCRSK